MSELDKTLCKECIQLIKELMHGADELETVKMISQTQIAELHSLQHEVTWKESAEAEFQQKLTGIQSEKTQLKVMLQLKESEYVLDEGLGEEH